jgi:hypothetical protein
MMPDGMTFRDTQLGRFGAFCSSHLGAHVEPDLRAAHALASDGVWPSPRPLLRDVLLDKQLHETTDPAWRAWAAAFATLTAGHVASGGRQLSGECSKAWPAQPRGLCMHELTPPLRYWSLRSFISQAAGMKTNVVTRANGTTGIDRTLPPFWNYVITYQGEILVAAEDFAWIKHTSIAAGADVWAAGQMGVDGGHLRLVDLQSGHYTRTAAAALMPGSVRVNRLIRFTETVFREYDRVFNLLGLHPLFACVWV